MNQIENQIIEMLSEVLKTRNTGPKNISANTKFFDLGMDSYSIINFMSDIESKFNISIPDEKMFSFNDISDIAAFIEGYKK